jgi:hypothetical protein
MRQHFKVPDLLWYRSYQRIVEEIKMFQEAQFAKTGRDCPTYVPRIQGQPCHATKLITNDTRPGAWISEFIGGVFCYIFCVRGENWPVERNQNQDHNKLKF